MRIDRIPADLTVACNANGLEGIMQRAKPIFNPEEKQLLFHDPSFFEFG
jgi:hypothetical protein